MTYEPFPAFKDWKVSFDSSLVDRYHERYCGIRSTMPSKQWEKSITETLREAAVDTGALEGLYTTDRGFTHSVAIQTGTWEIEADEKGKHVKDSINDAVGVYQMILDVATNEKEFPITEVWVRQLHEKLCLNQKTYRVYINSIQVFQEHSLSLGEYKQLPNSPTLSSGAVFDYASPLETPAEMARLLNEFKTEDFIAAHSVLQAAYAHYAFICIHPFADGNGRVARALASFFLCKGLSIPLVIYADQRNQYLDALEAADAGNHDVFSRFIAERVIDTLNLLAGSLLKIDEADTAAAVDRILSAYQVDAYESLLLIAERLYDMLYEMLESTIVKLNLPHAINIRVTHSLGAFNFIAPEGYRVYKNELYRGIALHLELADSIKSVHYVICMKSCDNDVPELLIVSNDGLPSFEVWSRELEPIITTALHIRLEEWSETSLRNFLKVIAD